jgi:hypothetical protein
MQSCPILSVPLSDPTERRFVEGILAFASVILNVIDAMIPDMTDGA